MGRSWEHWYINHDWADVRRFQLPGFRMKSYINTYKGYVSIAQTHNPDEYDRVNFIILLHQKGDEVRFELVYGIGNNSKWSFPEFVWKPIPIEVWDVLFKDNKDGGYESRILSKDIIGDDWYGNWCGDPNKGKKLSIVREGDRVFFVSSKRMLQTYMGGIGMEFMDDMPVADFLRVTLAQLGTAILFPGKVTDYADAENIYNSLYNLHTTHWDIEHNWYGDRIKENLKELKECQDKLIEIEDKIQKVCEEAADSMNILSDRYGIEVKV